MTGILGKGGNINVCSVCVCVLYRFTKVDPYTAG